MDYFSRWSFHDSLCSNRNISWLAVRLEGKFEIGLFNCFLVHVFKIHSELLAGTRSPDSVCSYITNISHRWVFLDEFCNQF